MSYPTNIPALCDNLARTTLPTKGLAHCRLYIWDEESCPNFWGVVFLFRVVFIFEVPSNSRIVFIFWVVFIFGVIFILGVIFIFWVVSDFELALIFYVAFVFKAVMPSSYCRAQYQIQLNFSWSWSFFHLIHHPSWAD